MLAWLDRIAAELPGIEDPSTATRISIGVATGADALYVRRQHDLPELEASRLLPLAMAADVKSGEFRWTGHHLVSPWEPEGVVDLGRYPKLAGYYQ
jgi:hypothetical protein